MPQRRIGVHTSIAGGLHLSLGRARDLGCSTVQIFSHSPRSWAVREVTGQEASEFRRLRAGYDISPVYVHASYLINLSSEKAEIVEGSIEMVARELELASLIGADHVVLHTGRSSEKEAGRRKTIQSLKASLSRVSSGCGATILLENTAGQRGDITSRMADLAEIMEGVDSPMIGGICLDTCHAFQAGYDLSHAEGIEDLVSEIRDLIGPERVRLIHLNDSLNPYNSRLDRHQHIGKGKIGAEGLRLFLSHPALKDIPLILETPKKTEEDDPMNLAAVRALMEKH